MKKKDKAVERMNERKNSTDSALKCTDAAHSVICSPEDEAEQNTPSCWKPLATADNEEKKEKEEGGQMCQEREKKKGMRIRQKEVLSASDTQYIRWR